MQQSGRSNILPQPQDSTSYKMKVWLAVVLGIIMLVTTIVTVTQYFSVFDKRISGTEASIVRLEINFTELSTKLDLVLNYFQSIDRRLSRIEGRLGVPEN